MNILKGDTVLIRRGKEKGKRGTVKAVFPKDGVATVEGINVVKRHTKPGQAGQQSGGIFEKEAPLPVSVLMYVCEKCNTPTRIRHGKNAEGASQRVCAKCGEPARESVKGS
jgi:large subunit ribosomal protein L24